MGGYKTEYFQDFDKFKVDQMKKKETIPMTGWGGFNFNFFEIQFENNVKALLFEDYEMTKKFVEFSNIDQRSIKYLGKTNDINFRVLQESINRGEDFLHECHRLSDVKEYLLFIAPFDLSYEENPAKELASLISGVRKG